MFIWERGDLLVCKKKRKVLITQSDDITDGHVFAENVFILVINNEVYSESRWFLANPGIRFQIHANTIIKE